MILISRPIDSYGLFSVIGRDDLITEVVKNRCVKVSNVLFIFHQKNRLSPSFKGRLLCLGFLFHLRLNYREVDLECGPLARPAVTYDGVQLLFVRKFQAALFNSMSCSSREIGGLPG